MGDTVKPDNSVEIRKYPASVTCLVMEKYRLINLIDSIRTNSKPDWGILSIPSGIIIGVLPSLLTNAFNDWLGMPKTYWWAFFVMLLLVNSIALIVIFIYCLVKKSKYDKRDASHIVEDLMLESEVNSRTTSTSAPNTVEFEKKLREREISNYMKLLNMKVDDIDPTLINQGYHYINQITKKQ